MDRLVLHFHDDVAGTEILVGRCAGGIDVGDDEGERSDTLVVLSVIDNLVKGASGQAVQNMNLMFGLPETAGLDQIAVVP